MKLLLEIYRRSHDEDPRFGVLDRALGEINILVVLISENGRRVTRCPYQTPALAVVQKTCIQEQLRGAIRFET